MSAYLASYLQSEPVSIPSTSIYVYVIIMFLLSGFGIVNGVYILHVASKLGQSISVWIYALLISLLLMSATSFVNSLIVLINNGWTLGGYQCLINCFCFTATSGYFFFSLMGRAFELYLVFVNDVRSRVAHLLIVCAIWTMGTVLTALPYMTANALELVFLSGGYFQCEYAVYTLQTWPMILGCSVIVHLTLALPSIAIAYYRMHQMVSVSGITQKSSKATTELFKHSMIYVISSILAFVPVELIIIYETVYSKPSPVELYMTGMICLYTFGAISPWLLAATCKPLGNTLYSSPITIKEKLVKPIETPTITAKAEVTSKSTFKQ